MVSGVSPIGFIPLQPNAKCTKDEPPLRQQSATRTHYDIREIDEDLYLAVLQAAKQAQSAA